MGSSWGLVSMAAILVAGSIGCGSSMPPPKQALADTEAADRAATELGAENIPEAKLHLRLAREQTDKARRLMSDDDNRQAADVLMRAKADAELALALAHEQRAKTDARAAEEKARHPLDQNTTGGAP